VDEVKAIRDNHLLTRDRRFGRLQNKRTRSEQKQLLIEQDYEFFNDNGCKHRFVEIFAERRIKRALKNALQSQILPFPKSAILNAVSLAATEIVQQVTLNAE
jgi:hypothetical protein